MQHLVPRDVVQHEADSLGSVQPRWHRNQFMLLQADELRVRTADRQRGNYLAWFDSGDTGAEPIHHANQIPPWREGQPGCLGMNALTHQQVGQGDTCGQHSNPRFIILWLGALFFNHPKCIGPAVVSDDDARVSHGTDVVSGGEPLGWSWLFPPYLWHFDARATEPTTAIWFSGMLLRQYRDEYLMLSHELFKR